MALPGAGPAAELLRRIADRLGGRVDAPQSDQIITPGEAGRAGMAVVKISNRVAERDEQRVTGWNAGIPQPLIGDQQVAQGAIPLRGEAPTDYTRNGTAVRMRGFEQHPIVEACVRVICDIASAVPFQVYKKRPAQNSTGFSDSIEVLTSDNKLQRLLDAPNTFLSAQRFRKFLFAHQVIYGNSFTYLERPQVAATSKFIPEPQSLRVIRPEDILTVYVNVKGYPLWYLWRDTLGYTHTSPVQDIVHVRDLSVFSFIFGYPRGAAALNDIIGDNEASQFVRQMVTNSGQAGVWMIANDDTTPKDAKVVEDQLFEQFITRGQRGRIKVLGGIKDVKSVAFNLRDLEFPDLRMIAREDICAAFGVDPRMIGSASATKDGGLSGVQYREARERLIKHTILPLMADIESEMNLWLAPEFGDVYVRFDPDALAQMTEDKQATSTRVLAELAAGARTLEETREVLELSPEQDLDDTLATNVPLTPVAVAMQPPTDSAMNPDGTPMLGPDGVPVKVPTPLIPTGGNAKEPVSDTGNQSQPPKPQTEKDLQGDAGSDPNSPGRKPPQNGDQDPAPKQRAFAPKSRVLKRGVVLTNEQKVLLWRQFDARATKEEAAYRRQALILFGEERSVVTRIMANAAANDAGDQSGETEQKYLDIATKEIRRFYKPGGEARRRWEDRFHPLIGGTYAKGAAQVIDGVKTTRAKPPKKGEHAPAPGDIPTEMPISFELENPGVQMAIRERATRLAHYVGDTTSQYITDAISIGRKEGMGIGDIAKLIDKTAFGGSAGSRSVMIARTETVGALNQGEFDTAGSSGGVASKEWLTQGDDRVRETHMECEDEGVIPMDDEFETNGMKYPGDPSGDAGEVINCRCTLLYYDTAPEDSGGRAAVPVSDGKARVFHIKRNNDHEGNTVGFTAVEAKV